MKNLYFVQASVFYGDSIYLPYASGALLSYAFLDPRIQEEYAMKRIVYFREDIDEAIASFEHPFLVCFSNYIWSYEYNKEFARKLKLKHPDCRILFGGHNVASDSSELLNACAYIDYLIHNEGEVPFHKLLCALIGECEMQDVPNLSYRDETGFPTKTENRVFDVAAYPSPYQTGVFDEIIRTTPYKLNGMLETNRGCPFGCLFCDWGLYKSKVRRFPMERIRKDIEWFAEHQIEFCTCADANFGILERDQEIVDLLIESNKKYGYPSKIQFCFTKGRDDLVFEMNKKLNMVGLSKGATLSMQTLDSETLKNIGRVNPTFEKFCEILKRYNELDIPTYTEIILGLPGETYQSFCSGLNQLLNAGQHNSIVVFNCEVLLNSRLGRPEVQKAYNIHYARVPYKQHHCAPLNDEVQEYSNIIVSTYSMTTDDWVRCNLFVAVLGSFHNLGVLQCFAVFLHFEYGMEYQDFYARLMEWILDNPQLYLYSIFHDIQTRLIRISSGVGDWRYVVEGCGDITWPYEEGAFLKIAMHLDTVYQELDQFLRGYDIPEQLYRDLLTFQIHAVKTPYKTDFSFDLSYDLPAFFCKVLVNEPAQIRKQRTRVTLKDAMIPEQWEDYARELVWFGKRGNKTNNIRDFVSEEL